MVKHYVEAFIGHESGFRVICEDIEQCSKEQNAQAEGLDNLCVFQEQFKEYGLEMISWPIADKADIILGRTEVKATVQGPEDEWEAHLEKP